jgi:uncharacterized membrane protein HdeD (DUF308 family)
MKSGTAPSINSTLNPSFFFIGGFLSIALGLISLIFNIPRLAQEYDVLAWILIIGAIIRATIFLRVLRYRTVYFDLLFAMLYLVFAVYILNYPNPYFVGFNFWAAIFYLVDGVLRLISIFSERPQKINFFLVLIAILALLTSALILFNWPSSSTWVPWTVVGINMLFAGLACVVHGLNFKNSSLI